MRFVRPYRLGASIAVAVVTTACPSSEVIEGFPDEFVGVGLELTIRKKQPIVVRTLAGGPSEEAGLEKGDIITAVDGHETAGMSLGDVVMRLRGQPNSQVVLDILRKKKKLKVVMRRTAIKKKAKGTYQAKP